MSTSTITIISLPAGACDSHVHVFGPAAAYGFTEARTYTPGDASEEELLAWHDRIGLARVVLIQPSVYGADNSRLMAGLNKIGARARAVAVIGPATQDAELVAMHEAGVRGVRVNLATHALHDPDYAWREILDCASRVSAYGWHVQVLTRLSVLSQLKARLPDLPVRLVVDHFGLLDVAGGLEQPGFADLLELVASGRVLVKLSAAERLTCIGRADAISPYVQALAAANPDGLVWGSDWPHTGSGPRQARPLSEIEPFDVIDESHALGVIARALGDDECLQKVFVRTPAALYDFAAPVA